MLKVDKIINQESFNCWSAEQGGDNSPKKRLSIWKNLIYHPSSFQQARGRKYNVIFVPIKNMHLMVYFFQN